jgi:hypothetical protein
MNRSILLVSTFAAAVSLLPGIASGQAPQPTDDAFDALLEPAPGPTSTAPPAPTPVATSTASSAPAPVATPAPIATPGSTPQTLNPDLSLVADFALAAFSRDEQHQTGAHDPVANGFNLQALELSLGAAVDPYFRFDSHIVFALFGVEVEEAYATTLDLGWRSQARVGQFLTRFGRQNATHPHSWDFVDQPLALGRVFGGEGNRGLGLELSYLAPLPWSVELVGSVTGATGEGTARSFYGAEDLGVEDPRDLLAVVAVKQFFELSADWSLALGTSFATGPNASGRENRSEVYGADLYLKFRPLVNDSETSVALQSEWLYRRRQVPEDVLADVTGYAQLVYHFTRRWSTAARYEYGSATYDNDGAVAVDPLDPEWTQGRTRVSANLTHAPTEFSRFRLQGSRDVGLGQAVWAAFLAAEFVIGAHGAHAF